MNNQDRHLNEDQITRAVVDENDLAPAEQNHLLHCSLCRKEKQGLEQVLSRMGKMSKELVPGPRKRLMPVTKRSRSSLRWQPALAAGVVIALLLIGIWRTSFYAKFQENGSMQITQKMENDQQLMAEITFTENDALPGRYLYIIGDYNDDDYNDYDDFYNDEFLEFVLPL